MLEITSGNVGGFYAATVTQYFGECLLMVGFTTFVAEMCHRVVPAFVYALEWLANILVMWLLFTTRENHYFYTYIGMEESGPFPRLTGGYEIPCLGIMGAVILVGLALLRYGYFDSIALAGENALNHGQEGIMVINNHRAITYFNKRMEEMFGQLALKQNAYKNETLKDIFEGKLKTLEINNKMYEMRVEPLEEGGYVQGYMLWMLDITEHHEILQKISDMAHKDSLTGVFNRNHFITLLEEQFKRGIGGSLFMMDLNSFRQINDRFGHQAGDDILAKLGETLSEQGGDTIACRIGGDEFCLFYKDAIDAKELEALADKIATDFQKKLEGEKYAGLTSVSFGITRILETSDRDFEKLYSNADKALYVAKTEAKTAGTFFRGESSGIGGVSK